jgi:hypothetical protein
VPVVPVQRGRAPLAQGIKGGDVHLGEVLPRAKPFNLCMSLAQCCRYARVAVALSLEQLNLAAGFVALFHEHSEVSRQQEGRHEVPLDRSGDAGA